MLTIAILVFACLFFYFVGYRFYAERLDRELIQPDANRETPAIKQNDGVDYVPSKPLVLFGHNFASIAGAGPVIGPIIAMHHFGWAITLVWIMLGSVFIGAVHDYLTLMVSVRNRGSSIADIAETTMGYRAKAVFAIFLILAMLLVIAVFVWILAWFAILFTSRYPRGLFDFIVGVLRWGNRVWAYSILLSTDRFPPFRLGA